VTHSDPAKVQLAHELFRRYPPRPSDTHGVMKVLRTGEPEWVAMIPDSLLVESAQDEDHLRILPGIAMGHGRDRPAGTPDDPAGG
ncbi:MAG: hypothetical protein ACREWE_13060, partial [Gammaproteobacteria bacterium]